VINFKCGDWKSNPLMIATTLFAWHSTFAHDPAILSSYVAVLC